MLSAIGLVWTGAGAVATAVSGDATTTPPDGFAVTVWPAVTRANAGDAGTGVPSPRATPACMKWTPPD